MNISFFLILVAFTLPLALCSDKHIPKEGEVVTWKLNPHFIVKTKLGERRDLSANIGTPYDMPHLDRFLGRFPTNYKPKIYPELSPKKANSLPSSRRVGYELEFDLALNNSNFQSNDKPLISMISLVHKDQVKVALIHQRMYSNFTNDLGIKKTHNTDEIWELLKKDWATKSDLKTLYDREYSEKYNLECYFSSYYVKEKYEKTGYEKYLCYSDQKNNNSPSIIIEMYGEGVDSIIAMSTHPEYAMDINWQLDVSNINRINEVNAAIWRLVNAWNVSPIRAN